MTCIFFVVFLAKHYKKNQTNNKTFIFYTKIMKSQKIKLKKKNMKSYN